MSNKIIKSNINLIKRMYDNSIMIKKVKSIADKEYLSKIYFDGEYKKYIDHNYLLNDTTDNSSDYIFWKDGERLGYLYIYIIDDGTRIARPNIFMTKRYSKDSFSCLILTINILFIDLNCEKIEFLIYSNNKMMLSIMQKSGINYDGKLIKQKSINGEIVDVLIFSILKEEYNDYCKFFG